MLRRFARALGGRKTSSSSKRSRASALERDDDGTTPRSVSKASLVELGALERCAVVRRPSARNASPYVADVERGETKTIAIAHAPNLDSGGKFRAGAEVLCSRQPGVDANTLGTRGKPKCELVTRLLRCEERENAALGGVWVSAHPSLVEKIAKGLIEGGALDARLHGSPVERDGVSAQTTMKRRKTESASNNYRPDFVLNHKDGSRTILEVKQVVDTDYSREFVEERARLQAPHPVYSPSGSAPYARAGIFPWGKRGQKGPDGEKVVSARAIEHLRELTELAKDPNVHPVILFICSRADVEGFRPNGAACPSFAKYLELAQHAGVRILVQKVCWGEGEDLGKAFDAGPLPIWPALGEGDEFKCSANR